MAFVSIPTSDEIDEMSISDVRNDFSSMMSSIVSSYGDDQDLPVRYPPTERPGEDE